ncbi:SH3 domain-containing protein [Marinivivus vitaminiproducens]|uniref:SH3 domain-containing protein n=1 Tax=Marinivivus vitaminiproducens TaxID=3035935 RepID=UPI0027A381E6|nr:SH3 domain-containing protein [Geminicoccaceae bacterium SCSIO 64248]
MQYWLEQIDAAHVISGNVFSGVEREIAMAAWRVGMTCFGAAGALLSLVATSLAAPGDLHRVSGVVVNLRAGPSDDTNVRGQVEQGEQLIEVTRQGAWYGVRVLRTGEEGWVYGDLIEQVSASSFGAGGVGAVSDAGFLELSEDFNRLMASLGSEFGYSIVERVEVIDNTTLRVTPSATWLRDGSRDAHVMGTAAMYQMWKNRQNGVPVRVILQGLSGETYVTVDDTGTAPLLRVAGIGSG